jgi:hypothetical protein
VKYGLEFMGERRARRDWRGTVMMALVWTALAAVAGWLWSCAKAPTGRLIRAGLVSDWVAYGVVGTICIAVLALLAWRSFAEAMLIDDHGDVMLDQEEEMEERPCSAALDAVHDFLMTKGIVFVSDTEMEVLVELARGGSLVAMDKHVRSQWKKRLFVTSLMELMALCARVKREEVVS